MDLAAAYDHFGGMRALVIAVLLSCVAVAAPLPASWIPAPSAPAAQR